MRKGLILAGGSGHRMFPLTRGVNKHLLPIYDKPMIYYPLTVLMFAGVREYVLISNPGSIEQFAALLGDGSQWGLKIVYRVQERPGGIAEGLTIARDDLAGSDIAMILGDNIFYGHGLPQLLQEGSAVADQASIFVSEVVDASQFGVVVLNDRGDPIQIVEKPQHPVSQWAVTGLYFYPPDVIDIAANISPSARGEKEISTVNQFYVEQKRMKVQKLGRGIAWLDGGTPENLFAAGQFMQVMQQRSGLMVAYPEEVALRLGYIDKAKFASLITNMPASTYKDYLVALQREL